MDFDTPRTLCVLGCGGFIGSYLLERLLDMPEVRVTGIDRSHGKIAHLLGHPRLRFIRGDIYREEITRPCIESSDAVISLAALCNPSLYTTIPIDVMESNFVLPYRLLTWCAAAGRWIIHFSTSEVYGKTVRAVAGEPDESGAGDPPTFFEDSTPLVLGPVRAQRWSYACAKQLMERMIYAYGQQRDLPFTIVRPFNFIGPRMDYIPGIDGDGVPRVMACFMDALLFGKPLNLVDRGVNRRVFTYIDDAVDAVVRIVSRPEAARGRIFNIGNPDNELSIAELAATMIAMYRELRPEMTERRFELRRVSGEDFYGRGYEDSDRRVPDITPARSLLGWNPSIGLHEALRRTMGAYIEQYAQRRQTEAVG